MTVSRQWWLGVCSGVVVGVVLALSAAYIYTKSAISTQQQLQQELTLLQTSLSQAQLQNQALSTQLALEQATLDALEQRLQQKQAEIGERNEQLAFYEQLLPLSDKGAVQVRAIDFTRQSADLLHYRLLLQRPAGLENFNGHIEFTAHGQQGGSSVTMVLPTAGAAPAANTAIQFEQFLRQTGLLAVPPDLQIDTVTLHIYQGKQLRATREVDLR